MLTINKYFLCSTQKNAADADDADKIGNTVRAETGSTTDVVKNTPFNSELSEGKNVFKSFGKGNIHQPTPAVKGFFAKSFSGVRIASGKGNVIIVNDKACVDNQKRIDDIVNVLLPEADTLFQTARTIHDNADTNELNELNGLVAFNKSTQYLLAMQAKKINLQNEAVTLFKTINLISNDNNKALTDKQNAYPLFSLIFSLSYSFEDVEQLLEKTMSKATFIEFASQRGNQQRVAELYQTLSKNSSKSIDNEILLLINKSYWRWLP